MADDIDRANELVERNLEESLHKARSGITGPFSGLRPKGRCHWCDEPVKADRLHCCPAEDSCAEDHERHIRFKGPAPHEDD